MSKGDPSRGGTMLARAALVDSDGSVAARLARRSAHGRRSAL